MGLENLLIRLIADDLRKSNLLSSKVIYASNFVDSNSVDNTRQRCSKL